MIANDIDIARLRQQMQESRDSSEYEAILVRVIAQIVGEQNVSASFETRSRYSQTTLPRGTRPCCIVTPATVEEVSALMLTLTALELPWKAISLGKNYGYGDRCASEDGAVIIDLNRMNRIVEINETLGYAVIEPGVSQGQLATELQTRGSSLMLDVTGAGPDASIVGNVLQRGFGHTPYGDRTSQSCNLQYVKRDGSVHHTGFGDVDGSVVGHVYPYGRGPNYQGMLAQSDEAVVTRMTIWLMPRPENVCGFGFRTNDTEVFGQVLEKVSRLRQAGTINGVVHFANDLRALSSQPLIRQHPKKTGHFTPDDRASLRRLGSVGCWNALGGLYGTKEEIAAKRKAIRKSLRGLCHPHFFGSHHVRGLQLAAKHAPSWRQFDRVRSFASTIGDVYELLNGVPTPSHLEGAFFRNRPDSGEVIDAGLIWIAPVIPCTRADAIRLVEKIEPIANKFGFDLPITISPVVPRAAVCITNLSYDKDDEQEMQRAVQCYTELSARIKSLGYPPYRNASVKPS